MPTKIAAVIGAGPSGMAVAKALISQGIETHVFEKQADFGGVWNYTGQGPMYNDLQTNIATDLMMYARTPFPSGTEQFCDREVVREYVKKYAEDVQGVHLHFNTTILSADTAVATDSTANASRHWILKDSRGTYFQFDFLVVASGHHTFPFYPPIEGLDGAGSLEVSHSRYYDNPDGYRDKKVLVVGNASSGADIVVQLLGVTDRVLVSRRSVAPATDPLLQPYVTFKSALSGIDRARRTATFSDGSIETVDAVLMCTGYLYEFPFLEAVAQKFESEIELPLLHPKRLRMCNLYRETVYIGDPSLAFICMNRQIVPLPLSEFQGAAIARLWTEKLTLPSVEVMIAEEMLKVAEKGDGTGFPNLGWPKDYEHMKILSEWADEAGDSGFKGDLWDAKKQMLRETTGKTKAKDFEKKLKRGLASR